jgi:hypothetical protein
MAVTFDTQKDLTKVERYDQTTGVTTLLTVSNFDIFDLGAEVGDIMCFGWGTAQWGRPWHNLYLSISTALDIDAVLTWYYLESNGVWTELTITTDNTNGFTQSGWIEFDCPPQMNQGYQNPGYLTFAIKCEITAFTSITTVGHVDATPLINDFTITVTETETMTSIKAANDSGSWGVVDREGSNYKIWSNFYLQGNLTSLDELVLIGDADVGRYASTDAVSVLQLGEEASGRSTNGSIWRLTNNAHVYPWSYIKGTLKMYASDFFHDSPSSRDFIFSSTSILYFKDSVFRVRRDRYLYGDVTIIDSSFHALETPWRFLISSDTLNFDNVKFIIKNLWAGANKSFTINNTDLSASYLTVVPYGVSSVITMIDCDLGDDFDTKINPYYNGTGIVKYNINLTIHDSDGNEITDANLKIEDSEETVIYDGIYSSGDILLEVWKKVEVNPDITIYDYNPFKITITKDGYQDYQDVIEIKSGIDSTIAILLTIPPLDPIYYQQLISGEVSDDTVAGELEETLVRGNVSDDNINGSVSDKKVSGSIETVEVTGTINT